MKATLHIDIANPVSRIDDRLFGSFIEHMGRAIYTGVYEPGHPLADGNGFRRDTEELIRPLGLSHIRYPGGNFLSGYDWLDGIGPKEDRPVRPEAAWFAIEPNQVGTDEFLRWCERLGVAPMMGVNLGTGTPASAAALLEYVNGSLPTHYADLRRKNGRETPYGVKLWCLGNEMDGPWQICAKTAEEYGRVACETAKLMKWIDPSIELIACGSSFREMPTFGAWERTVLRHCYPHIDYLSLHQYYANNDGDIPSFLARSLDMNDFIREVAGICGEIKRELDAERDIGLSFDEWNVWYHFQKEGYDPPKWTVGRPIEEERYDVTDALLVGCMLNTLINNADTVKIACLAQLVNVIAPIMTEPGGAAWAQTIYYPFLYASRYGRGTALRTLADAPGYDCAGRKDVPCMDCAAVLSGDETEVVLFLINRDQGQPVVCEVILKGTRSGAGAKTAIGRISLSGCAPETANTKTSAPFMPQTSEQIVPAGERPLVTLEPFSWNMIRIPLA
ncbi:MAG: alpha-N-arabinofuranosidase [Clostridiales Family XIII bacterium]|jgi:alpha-N-arabinofuranosidase|nr:alpha-N-arabinofuranosidase [Clostridiales Family XIII bacterium]